jgi:hypothetical protein
MRCEIEVWRTVISYKFGSRDRKNDEVKLNHL